MVARIVNPMKEFAPVQEEPLHRGINVFIAKEKGLIYIIYQSETESSTRIHILGKHTHLIFTTSDLRAYTPDGTALAQAFESIVYLEQESTRLLKYTNEAGESRMNKTRLCVMALSPPSSSPPPQIHLHDFGGTGGHQSCRCRRYTFRNSTR